ncbi:MAG: porin family protein [Nitrospira sp.]
MIDVKGWLIPIFCLCVAAMLPDASTKAESYVAGQFGLLAHGTYNDPDNAVSDLKLKNSLMYGAKLGHYMDTLKYFGVETEAYTTTPHIKQQAVAINGAPAGTVSGSHLRVTTWAANLVYRYPGEVFQPYAGVGAGIFFARGSDAGGSDSSISPGLNVQAGLRVLVTKQVALFGEYKFNSTHLHFKDSDTSAQYKASLFVFGVGYHF